MQLNYRGLPYQVELAHTDMVEAETSGKYRGQEWHLQHPRHIPAPVHNRNLKYRGIPYNSIQAAQNSEVVVQHATTTEVSAEILTEAACQIAMNNVAHIHCNRLHQILERRRQIAQERGDTQLLELLEKEAQALVC